MGQAIYGLNMSVNGADHPAYYSISLSSGAVGAGSFSCTPAATQYTYVSFQGGITFQIPGGIASAGAAATTTNDLIAGQVYVSPAIEVPVQIALYYQGKIIQAYEMAAGQTQGSFSWNVPSERDTTPDPKSVLDGMIAPPTRSK